MMVANNVPIFPMLRSYDTISGDCALPIKEKNFVKMGSLDDLDDDSVIVGQRARGRRREWGSATRWRCSRRRCSTG